MFIYILFEHIFQQGTSSPFADFPKNLLHPSILLNLLLCATFHIIDGKSLDEVVNFTRVLFFSFYFSSLFCANKIYCFYRKPRKLSNIPIIKWLHSEAVMPSTNHTTITARPHEYMCIRVFDMHVKLTIMTAIQYSSHPKLIVSRYVLGSNRVDSGSCQQV